MAIGWLYCQVGLEGAPLVPLTSPSLSSLMPILPLPSSDMLGDPAAFTASTAFVTTATVAAAATEFPWRLLHHRPVLAHRRRIVRRVAKLPEPLRQQRGVHHQRRARYANCGDGV